MPLHFGQHLTDNERDGHDAWQYKDTKKTRPAKAKVNHAITFLIWSIRFSLSPNLNPLGLDRSDEQVTRSLSQRSLVFIVALDIVPLPLKRRLRVVAVRLPVPVPRSMIMPVRTMRAPDTVSNHAIDYDTFGGQRRRDGVDQVSGLDEEFHDAVSNGCRLLFLRQQPPKSRA
jgi:hypothetical protein